MDSAHTVDVANRYAEFARYEVRDRTRVYAAWSNGVAADPETCALIETLPPVKRQPVLIFAAARHVGAPETEEYAPFRDFLHANFDTIAEVARTHSTQTNEARRCGVLMPFLSRLPGPLSLIEVGASAGLCLYPDRYRYEFHTDGVTTPASLGDPHSEGPVLEVGLRDGVPVPTGLPEVVHRAGIDLNPLDVGDANDREWLRSLVWPGQPERLERLEAASAIARADPPQMFAGDLVDRLDDALDSCPDESTPVVFHTAVLAYPEPERRAEFVEKVRSRECVWISVEGIRILPSVEEQVPEAVRKNRGIFVVAVNGVAMATAHGHGDWVRALEI